MPPTVPTRLLHILLIGLAALTIALLVGLSIYNHASPVDDYCFADTVRIYGFWQAQHYYYHGWTGRYFHNFIVHASPLSAGWLGGYKYVPLVMLALVGYAFYRLTYVPVRGSRLGTWSFVAAATLLLVTTMPSVAEFFFWLTGIAGYSLPCVLLLLWLVRAYRRDKGETPGTLIGMLPDCLLIAALVGSSETATAALLSWLGLLTLGKWLQTGTLTKIPTYLWVYWIVAVVCIGFLVGAPGNAIRMGSGPAERDAVALLKQSVRFTLQFVGDRLLRTPLLPLSLLYIPVAYRLTAPESPFRLYTTLPLLLAVLHTAATVWALVFLHFWAVAIPPAFRVQNFINFVLLLGWFYSLTIAVRWLRPSLERWRLGESTAPADRPGTFNPVLVGLAAVGLLATVWPNAVLRMMLDDLRTGRAKQYSAAIDARYVQLQQPGADTVRHAPLPALPASLFIEDIRTDPTHLWNKCWASYYHHKAVVLTHP